MIDEAKQSRATDTAAVSVYPVKQNNPLTTAVNGLRQVERRRVELPTSALRMCEHPDASVDSKALTATPAPVCTRVCTSEPENANADAGDVASLGTLPQAAGTRNADAPDADQQGRPAGDRQQGEGIDQGGTAGGSSTAEQGDPLVKLAAALLTLSSADRERLAAMLTGHQGEGQGGRT